MPNIDQNGNIDENIDENNLNSINNNGNNSSSSGSSGSSSNNDNDNNNTITTDNTKNNHLNPFYEIGRMTDTEIRNYRYNNGLAEAIDT